MNNYNVIYGSTAESSLHQDYELILSDASTVLSEAEFKHLTDIANVGYKYAAQKYDFLETLGDTVSGWVTEERRFDLHFTQDSTVIDFTRWYNETEEVKEHMETNRKFNVIPTFFVSFGAVVLSLFCICATILSMGIYQKSFSINPVYLFMFTVGFLGLLLTDIVAIAEWRKGQSVQK